jgi:hypothetical protein
MYYGTSGLKKMLASTIYHSAMKSHNIKLTSGFIADMREFFCMAIPRGDENGTPQLRVNVTPAG